MHGLEVQFAAILAREQNKRYVVTGSDRLADKIQPALLSQLEIDQTDMVCARIDPRERRLYGGHPFELKFRPKDIDQQLMDEHIVVLVVLHQENVGTRIHARN